MKNLALSLLVLALSGSGLALALDGHEKGDNKDDKGKKKGKTELKAPADCQSVHDAMEGMGKTAKAAGKSVAQKKHDKAAAALATMLEYAGRVGELDAPETVTNDEQKKEFAELLASLEEKLEAAKKAADGGDHKATRAAMKDVSKACGSCHDKYQPEEDDDEGEGHDDDDDDEKKEEKK